MSKHFFILLFFASSLLFSKSIEDLKEKNDSLQVLLIGNSFTYYNDMPDKLNQLFSENDQNIDVTQMSFPGYYLMAHLTQNQHYSHEDNTETIEMIQSQKWDVIILQESSFFLLNEIKRKQTIEAIHAIQLINNNEETKFYFFQTWTSVLTYPYEVCFPAKALFIKEAKPLDKICSYTFQNEAEFHQALVEQTASVASATEMEVIRFGEVFHEISKEFPQLELLEDDMHPSDLGAFINALVMFHAITNTEAKFMNNRTDLNTNQFNSIIGIMTKLAQ